MELNSSNDITAALSAGAALGTSKHPENGYEYAVVPDHYRIEDLERFETEPRRIRQRITLRSAASFIDYISRFKSIGTTVFADIDHTRFTCVFDYHMASLNPDWCDHSASYTCPLSRSWKTWNAINKRGMKQAEFAQFIEDNLPDIAHPNGSDMLTIARTLEAKKKVDFESAIRLDNGEQQFTYSEDIKGTAGKGTIEIPETFTLGIPVFEGGDPYRLEARLRYRLNEGELVMWFDLLRPERLLDDAFQELLKTINEQSDVQVLEADSPV